MAPDSEFSTRQPLTDFDRVDALIEQVLDLSPAERREVIETLLFVELMSSRSHPEPLP